MQRPNPSTTAQPLPIGIDPRAQARRDARAWLLRRLRWEDRLTELRAGQRAVDGRSGVLERPGRPAGVHA